MIHFGLAFNVCPDRKRGDTRSNAIGLVQFQRLRKEHPESYCARCAGEQPRTDSERYAELRALVEAWQTAHREHEQAKTTAPESAEWLISWLRFCDTKKPLLDWSHR